MSFDIKFTRLGYENACWIARQASRCQQALSKSCLVNLISKDTHLDWLQSLKQFFINVSHHILVASLTLMTLFNRAIRVRLATSIWYDTLMKNCFKDWSQSNTHLVFSIFYDRPAISVSAPQQFMSFWLVCACNLYIRIHLYFVYASDEGSGELARLSHCCSTLR